MASEKSQKVDILSIAVVFLTSNYAVWASVILKIYTVRHDLSFHRLYFFSS